MNKRRVYGIVGLRNKFANWNADFDGYPKRVQGNIYASDKAMKYVIRRFLKDKGQQVFYLKDFDEKGNVLTYTNKYKKLFPEVLNKKGQLDLTDQTVHLKNLLSCIDIKFFGTVATLKESKGAGLNIGINGPVQFTHGYNLYENSQVVSETITTQFASSESKSTTTIGRQVFIDEAHYFYNFALNENNLSEYENLLSEEDREKYLSISDKEYELFKEACLYAVDNYNSTTKVGCNNHFALFVETEEDVYLPEMTNVISLTKENEKENPVLDLVKLIDTLKEQKDSIKKVEIFYRPSLLSINVPVNPPEGLNIDIINMDSKE